MHKHYTPFTSPKRLFFTLVGLGAIAPICIDFFLPVLPSLAKDLNATPQQANATMSIIFAGVAVGQLIFGPLSDRFGRRPILLFGLLLFIAGSFLAVVSQSIETLLLARLFQAIGACASTVAGKAAVRDIFNHNETANFFSTQAMVAATIPIVSPFIVTALITLFSWRSMFIVLIAIGLILAYAVIVRLQESRSKETAQTARQENPFKSYLALLKQPKLIIYITIAGLVSGAFFTYLASSPTLMTQFFNLSPLSFSLLLSLNATGMILASVFNKRLLKTNSPEQVLRYASCLAFFLSLLFAFIAITNLGGLPLMMVGLFLILVLATFAQVNCLTCA